MSKYTEIKYINSADFLQISKYYIDAGNCLGTSILMAGPNDHHKKMTPQMFKENTLYFYHVYTYSNNPFLGEGMDDGNYHNRYGVFYVWGDVLKELEIQLDGLIYRDQLAEIIRYIEAGLDIETARRIVYL